MIIIVNNIRILVLKHCGIQYKYTQYYHIKLIFKLNVSQSDLQKLTYQPTCDKCDST